MRHLVRFLVVFAALCLTAPSASAQIVWNVTYDGDGNIRSGGTGFADPTVSGSTTIGQLRRDSVTAATTYLGTVLDGRGTVNLNFDPSNNSQSGFLAFFGTFTWGVNGSFQNGHVFQAARTNAVQGSSGPHGYGTFNFGYGWNYVGQTPNSNNYDMVTVAIHEIAHSVGFLSFLEPDGSSNGGTPAGQPGDYTSFDRYLQRGNGTGGALFNTDINSSNFASFTGSASTLTSGNDATNGLFFGGPYAREAKGGAVPIYAPNPWEDGSSASHVVDTSAVMNPSVTPNTVKRFQRYEIAMLLDIGWNVYNWNSTTGNWKDGVTGTAPNETLNAANSRWRIDTGIVYNGSTIFNTNSNKNPAPVLPPYAQKTSNIVLNFGGLSNTSAYTASNDIGNVRLVRLNLDSASTATHTINNTVGNASGKLIFGVNDGGTASVLTPKIVQKNSGAFNINNHIEITDTTAAEGGGWTGLTVDGAGSGQVNLGGVISGNGTLTKAGSFTLQLNGSAANSYTGLTTVQAGTLLLNKVGEGSPTAMAGSLTITGGTVRLGAADQLPSTGSSTPVVTLAGGTLSTGSGAGNADVVGKLEMTSASTIALGSNGHILQFTGFNDDSLSGVLTITGWTGNADTAGTAGRILVSGVSSDPNAAYTGWLSTVQFQGFDAGATFITTGTSQTYELVPHPIPEPATVLALAFAGLGLGALVRRRRRKALADAEAAIAP
jgi:autotransporter-associated beta strand protein